MENSSIITGKSTLPFFLKPVGKRWRTLEIHERSWCPVFLRRGLQDFLAFFWHFKDYVLVQRSAVDISVPYIIDALDKLGSEDVLDLCSGGGGPCAFFASHLQIQERLKSYTLTDLYPNIPAFTELASAHPKLVKFVNEPVDATQCSYGEPGKRYLRTMFLSMHHMHEELLVDILKDCIRRNDGFLAIESLNRNAIIPIIAPLVCPFAAPLYCAFNLLKKPSFQAIKLLGVLPLFTFIITVDGVLTSRRIYTREDFAAIVKKADPDMKYDWSMDEQLLPGAPVPYAFYTGLPKRDHEIARQ